MWTVSTVLLMMPGVGPTQVKLGRLSVPHPSSRQPPAVFNMDGAPTHIYLVQTAGKVPQDCRRGVGGVPAVH